MKVVIAAGGKGTRISSIASDVPKPMIQIEGKPILQREIECLRDQGFRDLVLTVSHLGNIIMDYFGDGSSYGVNIEYYVEKEPLGNAGALFKIKDKLTDEFLLLNADALFDIDFNRFVKYHYEKGGLVTLFTHPNSRPYDGGLIVADNDLSVKEWLLKEDERPKYYKNRVNAGLHVTNKKALEIEINMPKVDLDRQILKPLQGTHKMFVYDSPEYVKDMGTPDRYFCVCKDYRKNLPSVRNLSHKQKAIFLDINGIINEPKESMTEINEFGLIDGASEAIKLINDSEYLAIVMADCSTGTTDEAALDESNEISNKVETFLGLEGAYANDAFYFSHQHDRGPEGETAGSDIGCNCEKSETGAILETAQKYNIDLSQSWVIGNNENDIETGKNAGCMTVLNSSKNGSRGESAEHVDLLRVVKTLLGGN